MRNFIYHEHRDGAECTHASKARQIVRVVMGQIWTFVGLRQSPAWIALLKNGNTAISPLLPVSMHSFDRFHAIQNGVFSKY